MSPVRSKLAFTGRELVGGARVQVPLLCAEADLIPKLKNLLVEEDEKNILPTPEIKNIRKNNTILKKSLRDTRASSIYIETVPTYV
jgi:hypothetical protein